jgi:hypothetical protein
MILLKKIFFGHKLKKRLTAALEKFNLKSLSADEQ